MKKLTTGILLGTLLLTTTSMSFAARNTNIGTNAMIDVGGQAATQIADKDFKTFDIKTDALDIKGIKGTNTGTMVEDQAFTRTDGENFKIFDITTDTIEIKGINTDTMVEDPTVTMTNVENIQPFDITTKALASSPKAPSSFINFMKPIKNTLKPINKAELKVLEKAYNEAIRFEKKGDMDTASKKWTSFNQTLAKYLKNNNSIVVMDNITTIYQ